MTDYYDESSTPRNAQDQIDITVRDQEQGLDELHAGARRLKEHATTVHGEVQDQNRMLDDLGNEIGNVDAEVGQRAQEAREVQQKKKKICGLYCVIAVLVIILIVILSV